MAGWPGLMAFDVDEARQTLRHGLHYGARDCRRRRRSGHAGRQQEHRHAAADAGFHHQAGFGGEFHRRYDEAIRVAEERPFAPGFLAAGDQMQQVERVVDKGRFGKRRADMLGRARAAGIDGVEIHLAIVDDVPRDHRALQEVDVVEAVRDPRGIVQVLHGAVAVVSPIHVDHVHGSPCGAVMHARPAQVQVTDWVATTERDLARGLGQRVLHQCAREADPAVRALNCAGSGQVGDTARWRVGQADLLESLERGLVDLLDIGLRQRLQCAAGHAGTDRAHVFGQGAGARSAAGRTATGAGWGLNCHLGTCGKKGGSSEYLNPRSVCPAPQARAPRRWCG